MSDEASVRAFKKSAEEHGFHPESLEYRYMSVGWDEATRQAQAVMAERSIQVIQKLYAHARRDTDEGKEYAAILFQLMSDIRALSPDPKFLARKMAEERLRTLRDWPELCNGDTDVPVRHAKLCKYHREIARLERELAALGEGT